MLVGVSQARLAVWARFAEELDQLTESLPVEKLFANLGIRGLL